MSEDNDEDLMKLRNEALKSIGKKANATATTEQTTDRTNSSDANQRTKANHKGIGHKSGQNYRRNGFARPNLIVLTHNQAEEPPKSQSRSQSNSYTKLMDKRSDSPSKQKRVLPGRFSRRNSDDSDEDSDDDQFDDDSPSIVISAFEETSNDIDVSSTSMDVPDIVTNDESVPEKCELNDKQSSNYVTQLTYTPLQSDSSLGTVSDRTVSDKKETIKLTTKSLTISKSDAFERRKQKFGEISDSSTVDSSINCSQESGTKTSVKNRLSINTNKRHNNSNERNSRKSNSLKESMASPKRDDRTDRNERHRQSRTDSIDDCDQQSKKRLRSLVVMK